MSTQAIGIETKLRSAHARDGGNPEMDTIDRENRQLRWMLAIGFFVFLAPAAFARATGWRWRPWPPGPKGYSSVIGEARAAAGTYVPYALMGM